MTDIAHVYHSPGTPLPDPEGEARTAALADEPRVDAKPPLAPLMTPTHSPHANARARSNIVPDGPGTFSDLTPR